MTEPEHNAMKDELELYVQNYFGLTRPNEIEAITDLFTHEVLAKGDRFLEEGTSCMKLSFVRSGLVRIYTIRDGKEVTQWISTKGHFVTELSSFVFGTPSRWTIEALSESELYTIRTDDYNSLGKRVPGWHELEKLFLMKCFITLEDRVFRHLSMTAEERYRAFFEENKELFQAVPLQYIASMLGMTPETFSRVRRKALS